MNIIAPITLLAALISTFLFVSSPTAHAVTTDTALTDETAVLNLTKTRPGICSGMIPWSGASLSMDSDDRTDPNYNYHLIDRRTFAVQDYLEGKDIPTESMDVTGMSEHAPIDENWILEGGQRNHSNEIIQGK